jgi:RIO-like serine/threonine protein kinase
MKLIKSTPERRREVWLLDDCYRKIWKYSKTDLLTRHITLLKIAAPGYVLRHGYDKNSMWVDYKIIEGVSANTLYLSDELIEKIYRFVLKHFDQTAPFYHGDWQLSNIIVNDDDFTMVDWDNINTDFRDDMLIKLHFDLRESIGSRFDSFIDPAYLPKKIYRKKIAGLLS